jgi:hypothetical protein
MTLHEWKRELPLHRIREFNSFVAEGTKYYRAPDTRSYVMLKRAIYHYEGTEPLVCEPWCPLAECAQIIGIKKLCRGR